MQRSLIRIQINAPAPGVPVSKIFAMACAAGIRIDQLVAPSDDPTRIQQALETLPGHPAKLPEFLASRGFKVHQAPLSASEMQHQLEQIATEPCFFDCQVEDENQVADWFGGEHHLASLLQTSVLFICLNPLNLSPQANARAHEVFPSAIVATFRFSGNRRLKHLTRMTDIAPTLVDLLELPQAPESTRRSLVNYINARSQDPTFTHTVYTQGEHAVSAAVRIIGPNGHTLKVAWDQSCGRLKIFDLSLDPEESRDLLLC